MRVPKSTVSQKNTKSEEELEKTLEECFNEITNKQKDECINDIVSGFKDLNNSCENLKENLEENEEINEDEDVIELSFTDIIPVINQKYMKILVNLHELFKDHKKMGYIMENDIKYINEKLESNNFYILNLITDNYLYCLEQIKDHNSDYFVYQKETKQNKKGKTIKNKVTKITPKVLLKNILPNLKSKTVNVFFDDILEIIQLLIYEDDEILYFHDEYLEYIKENFSDNKNFNKMLIVIDNLDQIMNIDDEEDEEESEEDKPKVEENKNNKKNKKNKKGKSPMDGMGEQFMKGIEDTNIAKLAKNISEKINIEDYPILTDPSKLISSLSEPSEEGGLSNLLQFVVGEVQGAFKDENMKEGDLVDEAQKIMGNFGNASGIDPANLMGNMANLNLDKFADIFSNLNKNK